MDRVWLRDYENILSSNRRSVDVRPFSADISNNRVKKGRVAKVKKKKDNFTSELDVARQLREVRTDIDQYDKHALEKQERIKFQQKFEQQQRLNSSRKMQVSFKKLVTFDEFKEVENRREQCFATGDSEIFRSLYPDIEHTNMSPTKMKKSVRPKSSPTTRPKGQPVQPYQLTSVNVDEPNDRPERPAGQFEIALAKQALQLWKEALTSLRLRGKEIVYEDVSKLSKLWKRSESLRPLVVYISILLGLKSGDPAVTQRSLFRELYSLLKFFREVIKFLLFIRYLKHCLSELLSVLCSYGFALQANPLTLPKRRISKANTYYKSTIEKGINSGIQLETSEVDTFELNILGCVSFILTRNSYILCHHNPLTLYFVHIISSCSAYCLLYHTLIIHDSCATSWIEAMQAIFSIILDAKARHEIMNANFDEKICQLEAEYAAMDHTSTTPFKHLKTRKGETTKQQQHRMAKLSPTGTWSTRLTSPKQMAAAEEKRAALSMDEGEGGGLSAFDSTAIQSFLEVSYSGNIPLDDLSLEYSPDSGAPGSAPLSTNTFKEFQNNYDATDSDPQNDFVNRYSRHNGMLSPSAS